MPARQPFTRLCQQLARNRGSGRADLHLHSTSSDGEYTPEQLVELAQRLGLAAIALTDHDTLDGWDRLRHFPTPRLELLTGVELSCGDGEKEIHLLAYDFDPNDPPFRLALEQMQVQRRERFQTMIERLDRMGIPLGVEDTPHPAPGRRTLASLLVRGGFVGSIQESFQRWLGHDGPVHVPKLLLPVEEAIALVRAAGGVTSLAHPPADLEFSQVRKLADQGLQALEAYHPSHRPSWSLQLKTWARSLNLAVSGGSDCHGPGSPRRDVGAQTVSALELDDLRSSRLRMSWISVEPR